MGKPARPDLVFGSFGDMLADVQRLRDGSYRRSGEWDLAMILDHLAKAMNYPWDPQTRPMRWPGRVVARWVIHRMVQRGVYPSFQVPAPKSMRPTPDIPLDTANAALRAAVERVQSLSGPTVPGTPFGQMPLEDFVKLHLLHGAHHLSYLAPV